MSKLFWMFVFFCLVSCHKGRQKDPGFANAAVIAGSDFRMCACCGGLIIYFVDNGIFSNQYRIANPEVLNLPANPRYPIYLDLDWEFTKACGGRSYIQIDKFNIK